MTRCPAIYPQRRWLDLGGGVSNAQHLRGLPLAPLTIHNKRQVFCESNIYVHSRVLGFAIFWFGCWFHFRPPMYWEYTMDTKHEWSEKKTVRQIIASTRDCTGSQHWTTVFANSISTPREIENLVLPQTKEALALNWFAKTRVYFFFDKIGSTLKKWRKDNGRRLAVNGEYNLKKWYLFVFNLKRHQRDFLWQLTTAVTWVCERLVSCGDFLRQIVCVWPVFVCCCVCVFYWWLFVIVVLFVFVCLWLAKMGRFLIVVQLGYLGKFVWSANAAKIRSHAVWSSKGT